MKALNRQQRKAAIWKFVILYLITVLLIVTSFLLIPEFPKSQKEALGDIQLIKDERDKNHQNYETQLKEVNRLDSLLEICKDEKRKLVDERESSNAGLVTPRNESAASPSAGTKFGSITSRYDNISKRMIENLGFAKQAKGNTRSQLNDNNYKKLGIYLDSLTRIQQDLRSLNTDLKSLSR
jgi:hypothetical protein